MATTSVLHGSPGVDSDDDEDEFDYNSTERKDPEQIAAASLSAHHNIGRSASGIAIPSELDFSVIALEIPLLTYGQEVVGGSILALVSNIIDNFQHILISTVG
ncbi:unnamed protein product [Fraxinus pennsylvanica]|uniref:Uncharacterized protein n=1 Tax=Fraxinus pennsylvanica TaxID=56036 RepID=A0AAD2EEN4_9LAMI|nr:unnamed protein product [Fraxinus pennsylvanica]